MKKYFLGLFLFILIQLVAVTIVPSVEAVYFTPGFISKADMTTGLKINICPVTLGEEDSKNLTNPKVTIEELDKAYAAGMYGECVGETKELIISYVDFVIRKDPSKKVSDTLFMLDGKIFNAAKPAVISVEDPENPDDFIGKVKYLESKKVYNFDPSLSKGPYELLPNTFLLTAVPDNDSKTEVIQSIDDIPAPEGTIAVKFEKNVVCPEGTDPANPMCDPNLWMGDNVASQDDVLAFYNDKLNTQDWECNHDKAASKFQSSQGKRFDLVTCFKGDMAVDIGITKNSANQHTLFVIVPSKVEFRTLLMFQGQLYKYVNIVKGISDVNLLDYTGLSQEEIEKNQVKLPSEIEQLKIYPNGDFVNKSYISDNDCMKRDWDTQLECGSDTYMMLSSDDVLTIADWYKANLDPKLWDCKFDDGKANEQDIYAWYSINCTKKDESLDFKESQFSILLKPVGQVISEVSIAIPRKIDKEGVRMSAEKALGDFPLFEGAVLEDNVGNKTESRFQENKDLGPRDASFTYRVEFDSKSMKGYEYSDKILEFYKNGPDGWKCEENRLETTFSLECKKEDKVRGITVSYSDTNDITLYIVSPIKIDRSKYIPIPEAAIPDFKSYPGAIVQRTLNVPCRPSDDLTMDILQCRIISLSTVDENLMKVTEWYISGNASPVWKCTSDDEREQSDFSRIIHCSSSNDSQVKYFVITVVSLDLDDTKSEITQEIEFNTPTP